MVRLSSLLALSIPAGVGLGLGLWTLVALVPRIGSPRLATRVAPYVSDISPAARAHASRHPAEPGAFLTGMLAPLARTARRAIAAVAGGDDAIGGYLRQSGSTLTLDAFRGRQLLSVVVAAMVGTLAGTLLARSSPGVVVPFALAALVAVLGAIIPVHVLARGARARRSRITAELPTVLEFLTLALSAGEGILDALRRAARVGTGDLAIELGRVVSDVHSGIAVADALRRSADEIDLPAFTRTVDQLIGALERGTPLVDVLRAQVQDSRDESKRLLLESAGRKEIAMLVPLVLLILPVTVAFAIFPGILVLQLGF